MRKEYGKERLKNFISNIPWLISAVMWYLTQHWQSDYVLPSVGFALLAAIMTAVFSGSFFEKVRSAPKGILTLAGLSTIGMVLFPIRFLKVPVWCSLLSIWFVYSLLVLLYKYLQEILADIFDDFEKKEWIVLGVVTIVYCVFVVFSFSKSVAFYGAKYGGDIIYTSDSTQLVQKNVYLFLLHPENDLRQPLFAVAAAPFMALPYLLSVILASIPYAPAICLGIGQMLLLLFTFIMLVRILNVGRNEKIFFFVMICLMYPSILFSIMMEQYIVAVFWLILYVYGLVVKNKKSETTLIASAGSLLTSAALVVFDEKKESFEWKTYIRRIFETAGKGVFAVIFFSRMDVVCTLLDKIDTLKQFSGESVAMRDRLLQYTAFVKSCFFAPKAGENWIKGNRLSWQLAEVETVSVIGLFLIGMAVCGFWISRKQLLSQICGFWVLHSVVILCVLGWGTVENGLILYAFYYSWAYWILIYQFLSRGLMKCKKGIKYIIWGVILLLLAVINGKGILELLIFARTYFPT